MQTVSPTAPTFSLETVSHERLPRFDQFELNALFNISDTLKQVSFNVPSLRIGEYLLDTAI